MRKITAAPHWKGFEPVLLQQGFQRQTHSGIIINDSDFGEFADCIFPIHCEPLLHSPNIVPGVTQNTLTILFYLQAAMLRRTIAEIVILLTIIRVNWSIVN